MPTSEDERTFRFATENRLLAADLFADLTPQQWQTPSLCEGWTVREIAAHLVHPLEDDMRLRAVLRTILQYRGDFGRVIDDRARAAAERPTEELVATLRALAPTRLSPPFVGPGGQLADTCIHLRDAARPLGLDTTPSLDAWRAALDFLTSPLATRGFLPRRRTAGLRLAATDQDWTAGAGETLQGSSEALALAVSGRPVALAELSGPGVDLLADRIGA
jgi:uncharacterized protein (TIGR03083 family)